MISTAGGKASLVITAAVLACLGACGGGSSGSGGAATVTTNSGAASPAWAWISGSNLDNASGSYGTLGTGAAANTPGAREGAVTWSDASGNLWMFGGAGYDSAGTGGGLADLWEYSAATSQWVWAGGSQTANVSGVYGTAGVAGTGNLPGGRQYAASWTDASGDVWMFGGVGIDSAGTSGFLNDLWKYTPATGQWTWVTGSGTANSSASYGTQGAAASSNVPGGREQAAAWIDAAGALWLFGGYGRDSAGNVGELNDLWKFSQGQWVWISGSTTGNASGVYGTLGTAAAANTPGGRESAVSWVDASGIAWLFSGGGYDSTGTAGYLNDLWKFSAVTGQWTWVGGSATANAKPVLGSRGTAAAANVPGAREQSTAWIDSTGNFWLLGGIGVDSASNAGALNDLWEYAPASGQWTWIADNSTGDVSGAYGTRGTASSANAPGGRLGASSWTNAAGKVWIFGGQGYDSAGNLGELNDLWQLSNE